MIKNPPLPSVTVTKSEAAFRQIEAAIAAFWSGDYDISTTLAGAAEGMAPEPEKTIFRELVEDPRRPPTISRKEWISLINHHRDWLKHPSNLLGETITIDADDAAFAVMRAMQRWEPWSEPMQEIKAWYIEHLAQQKTDRR